MKTWGQPIVIVVISLSEAGLPLGEPSDEIISVLSCVRLCKPMDSSLPDSSVHGILQVRILERVVIPSSRQGHAATTAKSLQSCPTLCDPIDGSPPGSPIPGILQARTLEWVAISFSSSWKRKVKVKSLSFVRPSVTPWTVAFQGPPSLGFSRKEYWNGCHCLLWDKTIGPANNLNFKYVRDLETEAPN